MNKLLNERYVAVEGLENALEMAKALIKNDYQVMVQLDDCDIYIVAYTENTTEFGNKFTPLSFEEIDMIEDSRASNDDDSFWREEYDKLLEEYDKLSCEHEDLLDDYNKLADEYDDDFDDEDEDEYDDDEDFDDDEDYDDDEDFDDDEEDED